MSHISWNPSQRLGASFPIRKFTRCSGPKGEITSSRACSSSVSLPPVRALRPRELAEEAERLSESAGSEKIGLLRELKVVVDDLTPARVRARCVDVGHFRVQREWDIPRQIARVDHRRPHPLVGFRTERDRLLFDLLRGLRREVVTA